MKKAKFVSIVCISVIFLCSSCNPVFHKSNSEPITAILGAFPKEVIMLKEQVANKEVHIIEEMEFVSGKLRGKKVAIAFTGIGKVNAAMTSGLMIEHFKPSEVIFTGIAGGINPDLEPGDIVIGTKTAQHDLGFFTAEGIKHRGTRNPLTGRRNPVFFEADERLLKLAERAAKQVKLKTVTTSSGERTPKIIKGVIATGDVFVSSAAKSAELRGSLEADVVEMEGAAVAQICYQRGVACIVIRCLSDKADAKARQDWQKFHELAAENSARFVTEIAELLRSEASVGK
ncbi:MAG: 5'-methylthioadenosine/adenosylhomocysteine nucleosidase [Planctomycetota bacterium]